MRVFENGPLPEDLEREVFVIEMIDAFALKREPARLYCRWAESNGVEIEGFETWLLTDRGPSIVTGAVFDGPAAACAEAITGYSARLGDQENIFFVIFASARQGAAGE
ncbi:MAG TPA: hypothetical protein VN970_03910 [Thermoanaerobaculia bacterium]|jgi:hypothetical protein|nr:hypothetical protein [Thermoanaerobaculia bacterium]